jgi:hypothetical protein
MVDRNKSTSRQNLAHSYVRCDRAVELRSLPHDRYAIAQLEAAASLEIAQVAGKKRETTNIAAP